MPPQNGASRTPDTVDFVTVLGEFAKDGDRVVKYITDQGLDHASAGLNFYAKRFESWHELLGDAVDDPAVEPVFYTEETVDTQGINGPAKSDMVAVNIATMALALRGRHGWTAQTCDILQRATPDAFMEEQLEVGVKIPPHILNAQLEICLRKLYFMVKNDRNTDPYQVMKRIVRTCVVELKKALRAVFEPKIEHAQGNKSHLLSLLEDRLESEEAVENWMRFIDGCHLDLVREDVGFIAGAAPSMLLPQPQAFAAASSQQVPAIAPLPPPPLPLPRATVKREKRASDSDSDAPLSKRSRPTPLIAVKDELSENGSSGRWSIENDESGDISSDRELAPRKRKTSQAKSKSKRVSRRASSKMEESESDDDDDGDDEGLLLGRRSATSLKTAKVSRLREISTPQPNEPSNASPFANVSVSGSQVKKSPFEGVSVSGPQVKKSPFENVSVSGQQGKKSPFEGVSVGTSGDTQAQPVGSQSQFKPRSSQSHSKPDPFSGVHVGTRSQSPSTVVNVAMKTSNSAGVSNTSPKSGSSSPFAGISVGPKKTETQKTQNINAVSDDMATIGPKEVEETKTNTTVNAEKKDKPSPFEGIKIGAKNVDGPSQVVANAPKKDPFAGGSVGKSEETKDPFAGVSVGAESKEKKEKDSPVASVSKGPPSEGKKDGPSAGKRYEKLGSLFASVSVSTKNGEKDSSLANDSVEQNNDDARELKNLGNPFSIASGGGPTENPDYQHRPGDDAPWSQPTKPNGAENTSKANDKPLGAIKVGPKDHGNEGTSTGRPAANKAAPTGPVANKPVPTGPASTKPVHTSSAASKPVPTGPAANRSVPTGPAAIAKRPNKDNSFRQHGRSSSHDTNKPAERPVTAPASPNKHAGPGAREAFKDSTSGLFDRGSSLAPTHHQSQNKKKPAQRREPKPYELATNDAPTQHVATATAKPNDGGPNNAGTETASSNAVPRTAPSV